MTVLRNSTANILAQGVSILVGLYFTPYLIKHLGVTAYGVAPLVMGELDPVLSDGFFLTSEIRDWRAYLEGRGDEAIVSRARARLRTGRPSGDATFVRMLEGIVGRRLEALPRGRPKKIVRT